MRAILTTLALLPLLLLAALMLGERAVTPAELLAALTGPKDAPPDLVFILHQLRLPRALLALLVGAALGVAGTICQAALRNPLAEPGLIGINGGAALAVSVLLLALPGLPVAWLPWAAFAGAAAMVLLLQALAAHGGTQSGRVILIGIGLSGLAGGISGFLAAFGDPVALQRALIWMAGSLLDSRWPAVGLLALWLLPVALLLVPLAHRLDLARQQDDVLRGLGLRPGWLRGGLLLIAAPIAAAAVALSGPIGFVGLIAPHLARGLAGPGHMRLLPLSGLIGAGLLLVADTVGRSLIAPTQIPAGIVTALLGTPFLGWLIWRGRNV